MACDEIAVRLKELRSQQQDLKKGMALITQPKVLSEMQKQLSICTAQIAGEENKLADCQAIANQEDHPTPQPFTVRVKDIFCSEASQEVGKDEPYLLITSVDRRRLVPVDIDPLPAGIVPPVIIPAVHCFMVGPWSDVKPGTRHPGTNNNPRFWDLSGLAKKVASPQDVIFVVGLFENDGSSPEAIRQVLEPAMELSLALNLGLEYSALAATLVSDMKGTFDTARLAGLSPAHLNADDRVEVLHLNLTADDLHTINALGKHEKPKTFTLKNAAGKITNQYTVTFSFEG